MPNTEQDNLTPVDNSQYQKSKKPPFKAKRKAIGNKTRFEVFKRDSFTCQYCGEKAPNVVLEVDHIKPVAKGGENDVINYITSCWECNSGKGARELSDKSVLEKQHKELSELQARREQIEMMVEWRDALNDVDSLLVDSFVDDINSRLMNRSLNEHGRKVVAKWAKKFSFEDISKAITIAADSYLEIDDDGDTNSDSVSLLLRRIPGICANLDASDFDKRQYYVRGICRNRFSYFSDPKFFLLMKSCKSAEIDIADVEALAKECQNWTQFNASIEELTGGEDR